MKKQIILLALIIFTIASLGLWQCSPSEKPQTESTEEAQEHHEETRIVKISAQEMKEFGIDTAVAAPGKLQMHVTLPGEVVIPPDNLAHIHPRFPGIVKEVRKSIGDKVKKGEVLAVIESNESMADYTIKSLINGTVIEMHMTRGEVVDDSKHGFVIADLRKVWIILQVYQKDLPYVRTGQKVLISAGPGLPETKSVIRYISPIIDEATRTAEARVVLNNAKGQWKPGLFVSGRIITANLQGALVVPKTALQTMDGHTVIFVKSGEGFEPRPVEIGRENDNYVEIVHGLQTGETYISKGGFTLKADLMKSEFGDDEH